jgi:GntR family transcriptional regulator, arabinose operon transcriptional repressor
VNKVTGEKFFKPIYLQIVDTVKKEIISGKLKPSEKLLPEKEYCKEFGVSLLTLRRALGILEKKGFVIRRKAVGTFIAADALNNSHLKADLAVVIPEKSSDGGFDLVGLISSSGEISYSVGELAKQNMILRLTPYFADTQLPEEIARQEGLDGFILCSPLNCLELVKYLAEKKIPHVCLESAPPVPGVNAVMNADKQAAVECVKMLHARGRRKLAYLGGKLQSAKVPTGYRRRMDGFMESCEELGLSVNKDWIIVDENNEPDMKKEIARLLSLPADRRPDGIVCSLRNVAVELLKIAAKLGVKFPDDISVTCVDISDFNTGEPLMEVTGFSKDRRETGIKSAELLLQWIRTPKFKPEIIQLPLRFNKGITI